MSESVLTAGCVHARRQTATERSDFRGPCWVKLCRFVHHSHPKYLSASSSSLVVLTAVMVELAVACTTPLHGELFLSNSGVPGRAHGEEALVRWQRRLHRRCAGRTFDHKPFICLCESQTDTVLQPLNLNFVVSLHHFASPNPHWCWFPVFMEIVTTSSRTGLFHSKHDFDLKRPCKACTAWQWACNTRTLTAEQLQMESSHH